ncbi:MAG TPA: DUF4388 domain-containing protein, partial [Acidobacteriota bacterium]|nr:DUF4388 domain-containing protein [Acidobacteriota bacterium]
LVTDEIYAAPLVRSLLERDGYQAVIAPSADAALAALDQRRFQAVFIRDTVPGDYLHVVDRARRLSPKTLIRFYGTASSLIMDRNALSVEADLLLTNCDLFTSLLSSKVGLPCNHGGLVGRYADRLCRRLDLPDKDRILIGNAGYVHDLARYYYSTTEGQDGRQIVQLTIKLLQSLNYSPVVLEMLRAMYTTLDRKHSQRLPIELLGGNILTIADSAADSIPAGQPLSLDRFDALKRRLRDLAGSMFLPEVVEAFIEMVQEEILDWRTGKATAEVIVYADDPRQTTPLELRLKNEGFRTAVVDTVERLVDVVKRRTPDILILTAGADQARISKLIANLAAAGISTERIPTLLVTEASSSAALTGLLETGIEDIIAHDDNLDFLVRKLQKLAARTRVTAEKADPDESEGSGAHGRLADMSLLDLLQALGPSRKTVRITVRPARTVGQAKLRLYLNNGAITFARYADLAGAEAVYEGLTWTDGTWSVDPIEELTLPPPNNLQSNESILMEGCRLLDERARAGQLL